MTDAELHALSVLVEVELHDHKLTYPNEPFNSTHRTMLSDEVARPLQKRIKSETYAEYRARIKPQGEVRRIEPQGEVMKPPFFSMEGDDDDNG